MGVLQICKNCGKEIESYKDNEWYHIYNQSMLCYPNKLAQPEFMKNESCQSEIYINNVLSSCELEKGHSGRHKCVFRFETIEMQGVDVHKFEIEW